MECFEAHHQFGDPLDEPVVLFEDIVEIFNLSDFNQVSRSGDFQDRVDSQIGSAHCQ